MVIVMKPGVSQENIHALVDALERDHGVTVGITNGVLVKVNVVIVCRKKI